MKATKFHNTYKCVGSFTIYKNGKEYDSEYYEIKNLITTADNVYEIFENKLIYMADNEIDAIGEENVKNFTYQIISITNNNA
tara:strand:- start:108 stop:353 length:246 start_codon:yes stop_codon:yes gene_type:complete